MKISVSLPPIVLGVGGVSADVQETEEMRVNAPSITVRVGEAPVMKKEGISDVLECETSS